MTHNVVQISDIRDKREDADSKQVKAALIAIYVLQDQIRTILKQVNDSVNSDLQMKVLIDEVRETSECIIDGAFEIEKQRKNNPTRNMKK